MDTTLWVASRCFGVGRYRPHVLRVRVDIRPPGDRLVCILQTLFVRSSGGVSFGLLATIV